MIRNLIIISMAALVISLPFIFRKPAEIKKWKPGDPEPWTRKSTGHDLPLSNLFVAMLQRLGSETDSFADSTGRLDSI